MNGAVPGTGAIRSPGAPRFTLSSLQVLRGLAALAVVVYHTNLILAQPEYGGLDILHAFATKGWLGVNLFFLLSGFIIAYAHEKDVGRPASIPRYLWKRFCRIYPLYWIALTAYVCAAHFGMGKRDAWSVGDLVSAYTLLDFGGAGGLPLKVAWSLFYEIHFYLAFVLFLFHRRLGIAAFAVWALAIVVAGIVSVGPDMTLLTAWNAYFFFGIGVYFLYRHVAVHFALPIFVVGMVTFAIFVTGFATDRIGEAQNSTAMLLLIALPVSLVVLGATLLERAGRLRCPSPLVFIGDASYSIYLIHSPAISALALLNRKLMFGHIPNLVLFALIVCVSTLAGVATHVAVERPLLHAIRRFGFRVARRAPIESKLERA